MVHSYVSFNLGNIWRTNGTCYIDCICYRSVLSHKGQHPDSPKNFKNFTC